MKEAAFGIVERGGAVRAAVGLGLCFVVVFGVLDR